MRILTFLAIYFIFTNPALACGSGFFNFGDNIGKVSSDFNLDPVFSGEEGDFIVPIRGSNLCKDMPVGAMGELVFIDNKLVKVRITKKGTVGALLAFAERHYGESGKKSKNVDLQKPKFQHLWTNNRGEFAMYSVHQNMGETVEYMEITSRNHKNLFEKFYKIDEERINNKRRISRK